RSVTTIASQPDASARASSDALRSSDDDQYNWKKWAPPGADCATRSIGNDAWLLSTYGTPMDAAARATARSASACANSITPSGARSSGVGLVRRRNSTDRSRSATSFSGRGQICQRSNAALFALTVASDPAPPAMYANASALSALRAADSRASESMGTAGLVPLIPAR